jgi:predicted unusual protein kinase regulating ubiquinone biosynthesis (AarF/ABC1/UbiB family)
MATPRTTSGKTVPRLSDGTSGVGLSEAYLGRPTYDGDTIEQILSFKTCRDDFDLWWSAICRFFTILGFFLHVMWMGWWDQQIWSYIGEDDIDHAQSQRRHLHGRRITQTLLELGPTFIKVGQALSTRVDLLRKEYIEELSELQDRVPMFSIDIVRRTVETELGKTVDELFESFDPMPLAAASLGQVHRITLKNGIQAVIKVQRPNLVRQFQIDIGILKRVARFLQGNTDIGRGREWVYIVDEFGRTLFEEIDYIQEGRNADHFRRNFDRSGQIIIPKIYWQFTARRVIAMEYLPGTKINDLDTIDEQRFSRSDIAIRLVRAYFQQLLLDGFFHADPHPGNIVVDTEGRIILYDFGMVGSIRDDMRFKMVNTFLNIVGKRTDAILKNLMDLNMINQGADLEEIRVIVDWALDNYYDKPHDQLNFEELADEMAEVMYYYPFKLPASFTFMFRALITLEGVATTLYPQIQFMGIAVDYAQDFIHKHDLIARLFSPESAENYPQLIQDGLELLGFSGGSKQISGNSRVRLYHDEWKPVGRYIKAGFLLMAMGQTAMITMMGFILLLVVKRFSPNDLFLVTTIAVCLYLAFLIMTFGTLLWLPARRKPVLFSPARRHQMMKSNAPKPSGR